MASDLQKKMKETYSEKNLINHVYKQESTTSRRGFLLYDNIINDLNTRAGKQFPNARSVSSHKLCNSY